MSSSAISPVGAAPVKSFDPAKFLDRISSRFLKKNDKDGDGALSSGELSGLSSDAFKALDSDGDGKLSAEEVKSALKKALDALKDARQAGTDPKTAFEALQDTPEGQLLKLAGPRGHHGHHHADGNTTQDSASGGSGALSISLTSISITINQTIYTANGNTSPAASEAPKNLDVTA